MPHAQMTRAGWPGPRPYGDVPLVLHVIDRLGEGRMARGLVDIIKHTPPGTVRHAVLCLRGADEASRQRLAETTAPLHDLGGSARLGLRDLLRLGGLLRRLRPGILHSHEAPTVGLAPLAALAGVPVRIHAEHGRDGLADRRGGWWDKAFRRLADPLVHRHIAASHDIRTWMTQAIGLPAAKVCLIYDGIDGHLFRPFSRSSKEDRRAVLPIGLAPDPDHIVIGLLGDHGNGGGRREHVDLADAFIALLDMVPRGRHRLRLVMDGENAAIDAAWTRLRAAGAAGLAWAPDDSLDRLRLFQAFDIVALPGPAAGVPEGILRAMACGLPVVAADAGGAPDLIAPGHTGALAPPGDPLALARGLAPYALRPHMRQAHGAAGRARIDNTFSLETTVDLVLDLYAEALTARQRLGRRTARPPATTPL